MYNECHRFYLLIKAAQFCRDNSNKIYNEKKD